MITEAWSSRFDFGTPAGRTLTKLAGALPRDRKFRIVVFGSAPLQINIEPGLLSGDVDVFSQEEHLKELVDRAGLGGPESRPYVQVSSELNFRTSPLWRDRIHVEDIENCTFVFPHPIDILISKLLRLDEKDLEAFRIVIAKTGHPTEIELKEELQMAVDLFRPSFDEENAADLAGNTRRLWPLIYGREIDPRSEIIAPALARRKAGYGEPPGNYKQELRDLGAGAYGGSAATTRG